MFRLLLAVGLVVGALAMATAARADAPVIQSNTTFVPPSPTPDLSAVCGFNILQTYTLNTRGLFFTDASGALSKVIVHVDFDGSLIKQTTGEALPWHGVWTQTYDFAARTITIDGLRQDVQQSGGAPLAVMVGHEVVPFATFPLDPIQASTRADLFAWWTTVCTSFSA